MAVSTVWKVEGLDVRPSVDSLDNIISRVQWSITMEHRDETDTLLARSVNNGYVTLSAPDRNNFVPLENITHEQLIAWVKDSLGEKAREYETNTYNMTINQTSNTLNRMVFDDAGKIVPLN